MRNLYSILADLLEYPGDDWAECLERAEKLCLPGSSYGLLREFLCDVQSTPVPLLQECYTRIFDLNPVCTLEVGYHLFGENYKRGLFLANLSETEKSHEVALVAPLFTSRIRLLQFHRPVRVVEERFPRLVLLAR